MLHAKPWRCSYMRAALLPLPYMAGASCSCSIACTADAHCVHVLCAPLASAPLSRCHSLLPLLQALEYQVAQGLAGGAAEPLHLVPLNPLRHTHSEELHAHVAVVRLLLPPPQLGRL